MSKPWGQADRGSAMQQAHRKITDYAQALSIAYDIFDDIEPNLKKHTVPAIEPLTASLYAALADVQSLLGCLDYYFARCAEAGLEPGEARAKWNEHIPADFIETMRDWQHNGPNEINLVDQFLLKPMGMEPCPEEQD